MNDHFVHKFGPIDGTPGIPMSIYDDEKDDANVDLSSEPCVLVTSVVHQSGWGEIQQNCIVYLENHLEESLLYKTFIKGNYDNKIGSF